MHLKKMNSQLIYDVGAHLGEDTDFYLRKGFKVVAIEANPVLAEKLRERFQSDLSGGSLSLVNAAIAETTGEVDFYVNESQSIWGTIRSEWAERNSLAAGTPSKPVKVKAITFPEVLRKHGIPYYLKIDIEGADVLCLEALVKEQDRPKFISIESDKRSWRNLLYEFELFDGLGYSRFKIIDQKKIDQQKPVNAAAEGNAVEHRFEPWSSGLFGDDLPGEWLSRRQAILRYGLIFLRYRLFGDFGILRFVLKVRRLRKILQPHWYDTHATI
jgi:FkbM family methyltransferase